MRITAVHCRHLKATIVVAVAAAPLLALGLAWQPGPPAVAHPAGAGCSAASALVAAGCAVADREARLFGEALDAVRRYGLDPAELVLLAADGSVVARFATTP
jgi:hypothetical protein